MSPSRDHLRTTRILAEAGRNTAPTSHSEAGACRGGIRRVVMMADGLIVEQGTPEQMFDDPQEERTRTFIGQVL